MNNLPASAKTVIYVTLNWAHTPPTVTQKVCNVQFETIERERKAFFPMCLNSTSDMN